MNDRSREETEIQEAQEEDWAATEAIGEISLLYPPDSEYSETAEIGKQDMVEALAAEWRSLPTAVLQHMAQRQRRRDNTAK